jgi:hypothetical protein
MNGALAAITTIAATVSNPNCQLDQNARQWACATVGVGGSVTTVATTLHIHPQKFADFNFLKMTDSVIAGWSVRVPSGDDCKPNPGLITSFHHSLNTA